MKRAFKEGGGKVIILCTKKIARRLRGVGGRVEWPYMKFNRNRREGVIMALFSVADKAAEAYWIAVEGHICHYRRHKFGLRSRIAIQSDSKENGSEGVISASLNKMFPGLYPGNTWMYRAFFPLPSLSLFHALHRECFQIWAPILP